MRVLVMIGAVIGLFGLVASVFLMSSAPQQAAMAAIACGCAVIPYVGWRASQIDDSERERRKFQAQLLERLDALEKTKEI